MSESGAPVENDRESVTQTIHSHGKEDAVEEDVRQTIHSHGKEDAVEEEEFKLNEPENPCVTEEAAFDPNCSQEVLQGQRVRKLTEKGQELQVEQIRRLERRFNSNYERWKALVKDAKQACKAHSSNTVLQEHTAKIRKASTELEEIYEAIRRVQTPHQDMRRRIDTCEEITKEIIEAANECLESNEQEEDFKSAKSLKLRPAAQSINSSHSRSVRRSHASSVISSRSSNLSSLKGQDAAAEAAANEAALEVLNEQEQHFKELQRLEAEDKRLQAEQEAAAAQLRAKQEAENEKRKQTLEAKRREIERLETVKKIKAAKARQEVYKQSICSDAEISELLHSGGSVKVKKETTPQNIPKQQSVTPQAVIHSTSWNVKPEDDTTALIRALAESVVANRLPVPEPAVFNGDPLRYNDWKISFQTLIDRKNIPGEEKIYYLRKYIGGPAKKAVESFFMLGTETAYLSAWTILEERYGNPFLIAKAFRDRLATWPKLNPKNSLELQEFVDFLRSCEAAMSQIKGLNVLNDCNENQKLLTKLPDWLTSRWNRKVMEVEEKSQTFPTFSQFVAFLTREAKIACNPVTSLHALKPSEGEKTRAQRNRSPGRKALAINSDEKSVPASCIFCAKANHSLDNCRRFMEREFSERHKFIQENKLCFGCLIPGHRSKECERRKTCDKCNKRHPTCLHENRSRGARLPPSEQSVVADTVMEERVDSIQDIADSGSSRATSNRIMQGVRGTHTSTVIPVWVSTAHEPDHEVLVYALLDTQSDTTFILKETAEALNAKSESVQLKLSTMASKDTRISCQKLTGLQVRGFHSNKTIPLPATYSREFIPGNRDHIPTPNTAQAWPHLEHLSDEIAPLQSCDIGLLIGYNCPQALVPREVVSGREHQPFAIKTDLGWSVIGYGDPHVDGGDLIGVSHHVLVKKVMPCQPLSDLAYEVHFVHRTQIKEVVSPSEIMNILESDFIERTPDDGQMSQEDLRFLAKMKNDIRLKTDGHYEMPLPFKQERPNLPDNKSCAMHRLRCLERKLKRNQQYYKDYTTFMNETIASGDAEKVLEQELCKGPVWYIPHHGVYHPQKPGKIRVVFDCAAKFQQTSLNDHLLTGPDLTNALVGVLCRFRKGPVALMCDIERMFHQFHVKKEDQDYLRFLWWDGGNLETQPSIYRMKVHLFGAASSPGCANFGLKHIAATGRGLVNDDTVRFIQRNFYVDDGLTSTDTKDQAIQLVKEARDLCNMGKLHLHKFVSNCKEVLDTIPENERAEGTKDLNLTFGGPQVERALGVQWCVASDQFQFKVVVKDNPLTRRGVLSTVASLYDPLGFVAPYILIGKQILQQMCRDKLDWDDALPEDLKPLWESWLMDLNHLADISISRCYTPKGFIIQHYELHHFSDASTSGYGVCSYLRAVSTAGEVHCSLVMAKARVAPTKVTTIPRLELSAAVTAVRISDLLRRELEIDCLREFFWTDSKVVIGYINNDARRFHVFVANRVQRIKQSTEPVQWRYVASEDNPADHASRGLAAQQLNISNWFTGPAFLWQKDLPSQDVMVGDISSVDPEVKEAYVHDTQAHEDISLLDRMHKFSDWSRLVRAVARLKRRVKQAKGLHQRSSDATTLEERREAESMLIKMVQRDSFSQEMQHLRHCNDEHIKVESKLEKLSPFLDKEGVLRVGGRLTHAALHPHVKHPAILPRDSHLTSLLIKHYHERVYHQGRALTMNELRANGIWILGCSKAVSSHIYKCTRCRKLRRSPEQQKMADLPAERTKEAPPFTYCGMDCFGPFYVKEGRKEFKRYGLLLTCMASRAVHIEMLDDLSTDSFINALRAAISIRGPIRQLRCDQGTNFVGARREFAEALTEMKEEKFRGEGCEFIMNTPASSHMGGVWERQIRTIRSVLTSILEQSSRQLDCSSLRTFLYEVMAVINSRPLTTDYLCDASCPEPLTPNHILTMKSTVIAPPPGRFVEEDLYLRKRWRRVQFLANSFWLRWKKEYLLNLQHRQKWTKERRNAQVNDIVLLLDDMTPRSRWKLAKVTEVLPGMDGRVRKLKLLISDPTLDSKGKRTSKPTYLERPIQKTVTLVEAD